VARYFYDLGAAVRIAPLMIRPDFKDRDDYGDAHDLWYSFDGVNWQKVEVKGRLLSFESAQSFKLPTLFVDRCNKINENPADYYVSLNWPHTHIAVIALESREHWIENTVFDRKKRYPVHLYECPVEFVKFVRIVPENEESEAA
jgi:hypothetical protein